MAVVHNDMQTHKQFLKLSVGLGLDFVCLFMFSMFVFSCFSLDYFILALFASVVLSLVFPVLCQEIG